MPAVPSARSTAPAARAPALRRLAAVVAVVVAVTTAACGDDSDGDADASPTTDAPTTDAPSIDNPATSDSSDGARRDDPSPAISVDDLSAAASGAPAVVGGDDAEPPGPDERQGLPDTSETAATVTADDGTTQACCLLVAADPATRQRGLMEVTDLGGYTGMVFVFGDDNSGGFWMRNTPMPLSIAFFDADGEFVGATDMEPCDDSSQCEAYPSPGTYRFAVEVPQGDLDGLGVGPGSRLTLGGPCE